MKNPNDPIGNRTRDLQACSTVPQPTLPPCTPHMILLIFIIIKTIHIYVCVCVCVCVYVYIYIYNIYIVLKYVGLVFLLIVVFSLEFLDDGQAAKSYRKLM